MVGIKNNRRAKYTQSVIKDTVLSLLEDKPVSNISVTEVCKIADINRTTFYRYYDDIYQCIDSIANEFLSSLKVSEMLSPIDSMEQLIEVFYHNRKLSNLVFVEGKTKILNEFYNKVDSSNDYQKIYISLGMQGILKKWVKDGMPETPHQLAAIIEKIFYADDLQKFHP